MKQSLMIAGAVVAVLCVLVLTLGRMLNFPSWIYAVLLVTAVLIGLVVWLLGMLVAKKRSEAIASGVASGPSDPAETAAMREQFKQYLDALRQSPSGKGALAKLPWYVVIGAPGSGKTSLVQESGLAFASLGHGLRSIRGIGGTRNCDWWFTDRAIILDTAGRYTTEPRDQQEWFSFLGLLRRHRGQRPINGIIVTVPIPDLMRDHEAAIPAFARPIRERILEISHRLGVVVPVYVVFTKADMLGGFKDFFAGVSSSDRDQILGATLNPGEAVGDGAGAVYERHMQRIIANVQGRRLSAMGGDKAPTALVKAMSFPATLQSAQRWLGPLIAELFRPYPVADQPIFRGFYYTSAVQPAKDATVVNAAAPVQAAPTPQPIPGFEQSIFIAPAAKSAPAPESGAGRRGFFLRDFFAVVLGDAHMATEPAAARRRAFAGKALLTYGSILLCLAALAWFAQGIFGDGPLVTRTAEACRSLKNAEGDDARLLKALDELRQRLVEVRDHASPAGSRIIAAEAHKPYFAELKRLFIQPGGDRLRADLGTAITNVNESNGLYRLYEVLASYQMLTGDVAGERKLLLKMLTDEPRALARFPKSATSGEESLLRQVRDHVDYLVSVMPWAPKEQWQIRDDSELVKRGRALIGDNMWIPAYAEMMSALAGRGDTLGRDALVSGDNRERLTVDSPPPSIFAREAYDGSVRTAIEERAADIAVRMQQSKVSKPLSQAELQKRLRSQYARDHLTRWTEALSSLRPVAVKTLAEGADQMRLLTSPSSPYRSVPRQLSQQKISIPDADSVAELPSDSAWIESGLDIAKDLAAALDKLNATTQAGSRATDVAKIREFAQVLEQVAARLNEVANRDSDDIIRRAKAAALRALVDAAHGALAAELATEQEKLWAMEVEALFRDTCSGRFPFAPEAAQVVRPEDFSRLFNPKSGAFWKRVAALDALRAITIAGRELLPTSTEYQRTLATATVMREALFKDGGEEMAVTATVIIGQRAGVTDTVFQFGDGKVGLNDRPDRSGTIVWKQGQVGGAKISVQTAGKWVTREGTAGAWGILQLLRSGNPRKRPEGGHLHSWDIAVDNGKVIAELVLNTPPLETLVVGDLLKNFTIPARIGRQPKASE